MDYVWTVNGKEVFTNNSNYPDPDDYLYPGVQHDSATDSQRDCEQQAEDGPSSRERNLHCAKLRRDLASSRQGKARQGKQENGHGLHFRGNATSWTWSPSPTRQLHHLWPPWH